MRTRLLNYGLIAVCFTTLFSCTKNPGIYQEPRDGKTIYVESNDYHANSNAILAYRQKADGSLEKLPGSPFYTGGAGLANPMQVLGPDDTDIPLVVSSDGNFLLAVNGGSNTIAVFSIGRDGSLTPVPGSPFPSGGQTPCSIAINGRFVYVANKSFDPLHTITELPNYTTLTIDGAGRLVPVPGAKIEEPAGSSPSQVLVSNDHRFLFATDFLAFMLMEKAPVGTLESISLDGYGGLNEAPGSPYVLPAGDGGALGLWQHPFSQTLYVGFPVKSAVGVYSIDPGTGVLSFQTSVAAGAAACWLRTNPKGDRLYVLNSAENTVSIYNTTTPASPVFLTKFSLKDPGPLYGAGMATSSEDFALGFAPSGKYLYIVSQSTNPDFSAGDFNFLHVLDVAPDGTLTEPTEPVQLPVGSDIRPQGVAVN
ncbi:MAG: beta-propeller fold lactonase family protein [Puia sp.]|nr:beta-propeller fold lactonase family protein [Puia sp.]